MPRLPQVERCPTGHLPPDHNHNNRGAAGSRQDSHNDHGNTKYDGPQNNSAFPSLSKASEGDAAAGGAMKRGSPPANHSSYHTSSRENISLPAANNTRLRPTPPPLDSNKAHKGHHHHHTSQEKITEQHDSEQRRAERRRQNRRSRASVISEYDRLSRHHHREFLRLCGKLPPRGASGKSTTSTTAPAIANGATPTSRAEEDASPCSLGPSQTTSQATGEGGTSEWLIEATGSASDFIGSNQKPVLVFGIGTYGIAAQEAERKRRLEREQEFAQAKQLHQGTTGQQVEEPSATRSVTSTQPPPSDEAKTKQHKHRKMSVFSRLRKRKPHGFTASSMAEATLKRGSTQTGGGWLDRVHHTAPGEEAKGGPTHLPTIDSPKPRRSSTALGDAPEEDEEEEDTFAGTVGGVMDVFGYFSTHRVHPTYYKDLDVLAERGRSPGGSISNGTLTGGFSGTARRRGGGGAGGGGSNAPTDGSLHYFSDTLNNTHGRSPAAGATLAPLAKPRPPPRAPQGGKNSANGGARLPPAPPQCSSGSSLQGITPKKGTPSTNSSSGVGLGHVILMTEPKHNRM